MEIYQSEKEFEKSFAEQVYWRKGWEYIKIPDVIPQKTKSGQYYIPSAHKRPFDGILATPYGNWAVELKYGNGRLKDHQREALRRIGYLNGMAVVIYYKPEKGYKVEWWQDPEEKPRSEMYSDMNELLDYLENIARWGV